MAPSSHQPGTCEMPTVSAETLAEEIDGVAQDSRCLERIGLLSTSYGTSGKDIEKMCPLYNSSLTPVVLWALGIIKRATGTMSMVHWPQLDASALHFMTKPKCQTAWP